MLSSESDTEVGCVSAVFDVVLLSLAVLGDIVPLTKAALKTLSLQSVSFSENAPASL